MAKWNLIPSAEGPFSGLDAMARYCFGLLYDRFKLSCKSRLMTIPFRRNSSALELVTDFAT